MNSVQSLPTRVVIADDEPAIRTFLRAGFPKSDYEIFEAVNGAEALHLHSTVDPQLMILDLGLPDSDGVDVIKEIRKHSQMPIVVVSARERESEKVYALDSGADDYLTKPFSVAELLARVRVALRRSMRLGSGEQDEVFEVRGLRVDLAGRHVSRFGSEIHLTPIEYQLLSLLVRNAGRVVTHRQLLSEVWGGEYLDKVQYLRVYMGQLRQKLEANPAKPKYLTTEPGIGYRLRA